MKKACLITGIIWAILCGVLAVIFMIIGIVGLGNVDAVAQELIKQNPNTSAAVAQEAAVAAAMVFVVLAIFFVVGLVFSILMAALSGKKIRKGAGIAIGVLGLVFFAELPGIFFIIHSAKDL